MRAAASPIKTIPAPLTARLNIFSLTGKKSRFGLLSTRPAAAVGKLLGLSGNQWVSLTGAIDASGAADVIGVASDGT